MFFRSKFGLKNTYSISTVCDVSGVFNCFSTFSVNLLVLKVLALPNLELLGQSTVGFASKSILPQREEPDSKGESMGAGPTPMLDRAP
jgi:hypothetical protein